MKSSPIEIHDNKFTGCNSLNGIISLKRESDQTGSILIHNNEFTENSAIIGSNVLNIYLLLITNIQASLLTQI